MTYVRPDDRERLVCETETILATAEVYEYKYRIVRPDGEIS